MLTVACVQNGSKYPVAYVDRLYAGVCRNLTVPFAFHVERKLPSFKGVDGCWSKLHLFELGGPILYFDLDVVIVGNIDHLVNRTTRFMGMCDPRVHKDGRLKLNSSVMSWNPLTDGVDRVRKEHALATNFDGWRGDQEFIDHYIEVWQPMDGVHSMKRGGAKDQFTLLPDTAVAVFHGTPKPHEMLHLPWVKEHWRT